MQKEYVDFILDIEEGKDFIVLQITDTQIIDSSQKRRAERLSKEEEQFWLKDKKEERCFQYLREIIRETKPDLILLTGDIVYGEFDDDGSCFTEFVEFMNQYDIPWAPVFGNHDNESMKGVDWQCEQLKHAKKCLFLQRELTGNGNYTVGIRKGNEFKRVFFMLDSNGCKGMSEKSLANGHSTTKTGFGQDQIAWYTTTAKNIGEVYPNAKLSFAFHIQPQIFANAFEKYGFVSHGKLECPINVDTCTNLEQGDFGYIGSGLKSVWDKDYSVWKGLKALGVDSIFVGHEHCNSASVVYEGVRCQYGQKTGTYDRSNYLRDGKIVGSYTEVGLPIVGGTVFKVSEIDGTIQEPYIYVCKNEKGR